MKKSFTISLIAMYAVLWVVPSTWGMTDDHAGHATKQTNYRTELLSIRHAWAQIKYHKPKAERRHAFASLLHQSEALNHIYPDQAEAMAWSAVILYHYAGEVGGLKALGMVKQSYHILLRAEAINPKAANGLIYTALGQLYYRVPGWPVAFGNDTKAKSYLRKALELNPDGLDANYFMGDYLLRKKRYRQAAEHLQRAIQAPPRKQFSIADAGRKADALALLQQVEHKI